MCNFRLACRESTRLVDPHHYRYEDLDSESILLLEDGHCLRDHALSACRIRSLKSKRHTRIRVIRIPASMYYSLIESFPDRFTALPVGTEIRITDA